MVGKSKASETRCKRKEEERGGTSKERKKEEETRVEEDAIIRTNGLEAFPRCTSNYSQVIFITCKY
jgi:hypothetical protein